MVPPETHTQPRQIRIADELWLPFALAAEQAGTDRSTLVRQFIAWYLRQPGAKLPSRPERRDPA